MCPVLSCRPEIMCLAFLDLAHESNELMLLKRALAWVYTLDDRSPLRAALLRFLKTNIHIK